MSDSQNEQAQICAKAGSATMPPSPMDIVGVATSTVNESPIYGVRVNPEHGESGWYIWAGKYSDAIDFFQSMHVSHIGSFFSITEKYLALEPGYKFIVDHHSGYEDIWLESV